MFYGNDESAMKALSNEYRAQEYLTPYAAESIDAANVLLNCIAKGVSTRDAMLKCVKAYSGKSLTGTTIKFDKNGDVAGGVMNGFEVKDGVIKFTGPIK